MNESNRIFDSNDISATVVKRLEEESNPSASLFEQHNTIVNNNNVTGTDPSAANIKQQQRQQLAGSNKLNHCHHNDNECDNFLTSLSSSSLLIKEQQSENELSFQTNHCSYLIDDDDDNDNVLESRVECNSKVATTNRHLDQNHQNASSPPPPSSSSLSIQQTPVLSPSSPSTALECSPCKNDEINPTELVNVDNDDDDNYQSSSALHETANEGKLISNCLTRAEAIIEDDIYAANLQRPVATSSFLQTKHVGEAHKYNHNDSMKTISQIQSFEETQNKRGQRKRTIVRKFQKFNSTATAATTTTTRGENLTSTPAPNVKIGQRCAYKEYYGTEFGTIRWIGRVPQISFDWTVGIEFDNAIGEGDGSLNGRRYFVAKDCFARFLPLNCVALVDQHVGRPEPGTMISVMSASVRPGQMISIQRVSTVHVQHCFLNAPHRKLGPEFLAVNTRLHCQCPNCGPCAHVVKPPRSERLKTGKNATHMCQFSTYTCCGMESQEEALCTYTGNRISSPSPQPLLHFNHYSEAAAARQKQTDWINDENSTMTYLQAKQNKFNNQQQQTCAPTTTTEENSNNLNGSINCCSSKDNYCSSRNSNMKLMKRPHSADHHSNFQPSPIYTNVEQNFQNECNESNCCNQKENNLITSKTTTSFASQKVIENSTTLMAKADANDHDDNDKLFQLGESKIERAPTVEAAASAAVGTNQMTITSVRDVNVSCATIDDGLQQHQHQRQKSSELKGTDNSTLRRGANKLKSTKVVYRDSIENRYLFPTDDNNNDDDGDDDDDDNVIDSTLEADLENLSQARYGQLRAGGGGEVRRSENVSTRTILKSLRSLVSCVLSARSNHSELESRSQKSTSFRIIARPQNDINTSNNRKEFSPINVNNDDKKCDERVVQSCYGCNCKQCCGDKILKLVDHYQGEERVYSNSSEHYAGTFAEALKDNSAQSMSPLAALSHKSPGAELLTCSIVDKRESLQQFFVEKNEIREQICNYSNYCLDCQDKFCNNDKCCNLDNHKKLSDSSGSSSGFRDNSPHKDLVPPVVLSSLEAQIEVEESRKINLKQLRQISSSSDCGISSAPSQNSINLCSSPLLPTSSYSPMNSAAHINHFEQQLRMNQIYKRIATKLISSNNNTNSTIANDDLIRLKSAIFDMHSDNCCLHTSHSETFNNQFLKAKTYSCSNNRESPILSPSNGENCLENNDSPLVDDKQEVPSEKSLHTERVAEEIPIKVDKTNAQSDIETTSTNKIVELPAAFELKLTLSINNSNDKTRKKVTEVNSE